MKERFTQSMAWLHTWGGLLPGWLLFVIFFGGTLACFDKEITLWMNPAAHAAVDESKTFSFDRSAQHLKSVAPADAVSWWLRSPKSREPYGFIGWVNQDRSYEYRIVNTDGSKILKGHSEGGDFFFRLHYRLGMSSSLGIWLVGFAGMCMLVALITGIVVHKRIFKDFFTFRPHGSKQRAWLDAHNASSVLALPFHLLITYTGLVIFFMTYFPAGVLSAYEGDSATFSKEADGGFRREAGGQAAEMQAIDPLVEQAEAHWGEDGNALWVNVVHPGDNQSYIAVFREQPNKEIAWINDAVYFDGVTGDTLHVSQPAVTGHHIEHFLSGLHFAQFGGQVIRWFYLAMGLSGCVMIASGLLFWIEKRQQRHGMNKATRGFFIVRGLNAAATAGLPIAAAAYFWINRLLPIGISDRSGWEQMCFYSIWLLALAHALWRSRSPRLWQEQLWTGAVLWSGIPLVNLFTTENGHLLVTVPAGTWSLAGIDLMAILFGAILGSVAWRQKQKKHRLRTASGMVLNPREMER